MIKAQNLRTEYLVNPIGVSIKSVRFSFNGFSLEHGQRQIAYRIVVKESGKIVWDSGKVLSSATSGIAYAGESLKPRTKYAWQVKIYAESGEESEFSNEQTFETCLSYDEWQAIDFISAKTDGLPIFRKKFNLANKKIASARVYVCGLGVYKLFLNGNPVSKDVLNPMPTRYHNRYLFNTYDITSLVNCGENSFGVMLGNGFYSMADNGVDWQKTNWANAPWADCPKFKLLAFIKYDDGEQQTCFSDESWKFFESPIRIDEGYYGEYYDGRLFQHGWDLPNFNDETWKFAQKVNAPKGVVEPQIAPSCRVVKELPLKVLYNRQNEILFDTQEMTTGWVKIVASGECGAEIQVSYSEWLSSSGELDQKYLLGNWKFKGRTLQPQTDCFALSGSGEEILAPIFQYKGFRYVRVRIFGQASVKSVIAQVVRANLEQTGEFSCSNDLFNAIHSASKNALLNNLHGYPSDTPVYEKMGYLADGYLTQEMAHYNFDATLYYEKWARDIIDQAKEDGYIEQTAPMWDEDKENAPEWSVAIAVVPYQLYKQTGDNSLLIKCYDKAKRVFDYQIKLTQNYIATSMWGDHACNNDKTIKEISATAWLFYMANVLVLVAEMQGKNQDASYYKDLSSKIKNAFNERFFDSEKGYYCQDNSGEFTLNAQVIPCALGLAESKEKRLIGGYLKKNDVKFICGIFGVKCLFEMAGELGLEDAVYAWANSKDVPSWGYWLSFGDGSLWEQWGDFTRSRNHHMFATVDEWFYKTVGGVKVVDSKTLCIEPLFYKDLSWAKATVQTVNGMAECSWHREDNFVSVKVVIPFNATANVKFSQEKGAQVFESGLLLASCDGVKNVCESDGFISFEIASGEYEFKIKK